MNSSQLLQSLKDTLTIKSQLEDSDLQCSVESSDQKTALATIALPVEGGFRLFQVRATEIGLFQGLGV